MPERDQWFDFQDLRGGRNGGDPPQGIDPDQVNEALNVDYRVGLVASKRRGSVAIPLTFSSGGPFNYDIFTLFRHVPGVETLAELWAIAGTGLIGRLAGSAQWQQVTPYSVFASNVHLTYGKSFNGKLFFANYDTNTNRMQLWDGAKMRPAGLAPGTGPPFLGAAPAGLVTDTRRYWSSFLVRASPTDVLRRSELSQGYAEVALTAQQMLVGATGPGEGETHWELWGSSLKNNYQTMHYIGEAATGAGITDNLAVLSGPAPAPYGTYNVPPSPQFVAIDGDRVVMGGATEPATTAPYGHTVPKTTRIWWTPRLGDRDIADDERIPNTVGSGTIPAIRNYLDVDRDLTGLDGPVDGSLYAFAYDRIWRLVATGQVAAAYKRVPLGVPYGCIHHKGLCLGEDEHGQTALYFPSLKGPARIDTSGPVFCGWDVQDLWARINLQAFLPVHSVYHADLHQVWMHIALDGNVVPNVRLVFDTLRGRLHEIKGIVHGWTLHTGPSITTICSAMFSDSVGATMGYKLKPYTSLPSVANATPSIYKCDTPDLHDNGVPFRAFIERVMAPPMHSTFRLAPSWLLTNAAPGVSLRQTITPDYGTQGVKSADVSLAPEAGETRVWKMIEDSGLSGIDQSAVVRLGDASAVANYWYIDRWTNAVDKEQPR